MSAPEPAPEPIRVLIVDDHEMVRNGLAMFLRVARDVELVGEAASGSEGVRQCAALQPDVVLMDMVMSDMDGPAATRVIRERWPEVQVIALTSRERDVLRLITRGMSNRGIAEQLIISVSTHSRARSTSTTSP